MSVVSESEAITKACEKKLKTILNVNQFRPNKEEIQQIIKETFDYTPYEAPIEDIEKLTTKMKNAYENPLLFTVKIEDQEWEIKLSFYFYVSPTQIKVIFRDFIRDYPQFLLQYDIFLKSENSKTGIGGNLKLSIGRVLALLRNYEIEWNE